MLKYKPFLPNAPFSLLPYGFWGFEGVEKGCDGSKWFNILFFGRFLEPIDTNDGYTEQVMQIPNKVTITGHVNETFINFIKFLEPIDVTDGYTTQAMQIRNKVTWTIDTNKT